VLRLHTKLSQLYRSKIERLAESLNAPDTVTEAVEVMRGLIDRIVLTPEGEILRAELHGDLAVLARFAQAKQRRAEPAGDSALRLSVVAGARNHLNLLLTAAHIYPD
jgi:site-specific DNA recombinase